MTATPPGLALIKRILTDSNGVPYASATVQVRDSNNNLVRVYASSAGTNPTLGSTVTDASGNVAFYVVGGRSYTLSIVNNGVVLDTWYGVSPGDNQGFNPLTSLEATQTRNVLAGGQPQANLVQNPVYIPNPVRAITSQYTIWFPLQEGSGTTVSDQSGTLTGTLQNQGTPDTTWTNLPGITFNGSNKFVPLIGGQQAGFTTSAKACGDLSTLQTNKDMILIWGVLSHPTTLTQACILSWGMSADTLQRGGWALTTTAAGKLQIRMTSPGTNTSKTTTCGTNGMAGKAGDNTRSAFAVEIGAASVAGYLEARFYQLTLAVDGSQQQVNDDIETFLATVGAGTGPVDTTVTSPFMIGAWNSTSAAAQTLYMGANHSLVNLGIQRRANQQGLGMMVCRNLRDNIYAFPSAARILE